MTNLMIKSTLYDMLSMIIPGYLMVLWGKIIFFERLNFHSNIENIVAVFTLSYLIGIILHTISKKIFNPILHNNPTHIKNEYDRFKTSVTGLKDLAEKQVVPEYYKAYYNVLTYYSYAAIPIIETQISFIRSIICVIPFYLFTAQCINVGFSPCKFIGLLLLLMIALIFLVIYLQGSIYYRVWEDNYYIKQAIKNERNETNSNSL